MPQILAAKPAIAVATSSNGAPTTAAKINYVAAARSKVQFAPNTATSGPVDDSPGATPTMQRMAQRQAPPRLCPSLAPAPSYASVKTRFALSRHPDDIQVYANNVHPKQDKGWFDNGVCVISPYHRGTFKQGDVVSVPFHISNTNPNVDKYQKEIQTTAQGPVYSKRRMFIVLFKAREGMFCLPFYSWHQVGIEKKDDGRGLIDDESTTCQLVGGQWISYNEDIGKVGRITQSSYDQMLFAWTERCKAYWRDKDSFPVEGEQDYRFVKLNAPPSRIGGQSQAPSRRSQASCHSQAPSGYSQTPSRPSYASSRNSYAASLGSMVGSNWRRGKTDHWSPGQPY